MFDTGLPKRLEERRSQGLNSTRKEVVTSFYIFGADDQAFLSVEIDGVQRHEFQLCAEQVARLGQICVHVANRLEQGKTAS